MRDLFVIVGMSAVGKSTLTREFCEHEHSFEYFRHDWICRYVRSIFNVDKFSNRDNEKWGKLNRLGNINLASYWVHLVMMMQMQGEICFAEGYRYYFQKEREVLEIAVRSIHNNCRIHYLHLNPPLERRNEFLRIRGQKPITQAELNRTLSKFNLEFFSREIQDKDGLADFVAQYIRDLKPTGISKNMLDKSMFVFHNTSFLRQPCRDIESIKITYRNKFALYIQNRFVKRLIKKWNRTFQYFGQK